MSEVATIVGALAALAAFFAGVFAALRYVIRAEIRDPLHELHQRLTRHLDDEEQDLLRVGTALELIADHVALPDAQRVFRPTKTP